MLCRLVGAGCWRGDGRSLLRGRDVGIQRRRYGGFLLFAETVEEGEEAVEVAFEHHTDALGGLGRAQVVVLVVVAVVGFQAPASFAVEQILKVEVADELTAVQSVVAVAEVAVEQQPVVEQPRRQGHVHLHVAEIATVAAEGRRDVPVVGNLPEQIAELRGDG